METAEGPKNQQMDKENNINAYTYVYTPLLSHEGNYVICRKMDETGSHQAR
jgi:hypothetical protein